MFNRINLVGDSEAIYFELCYEGRLLKKIVVEFFDEKNVNWNPINFILQPDISNASDKYTFHGPNGPDVKLVVQQSNDIYIKMSKSPYIKCPANKALYYTKEQYANLTYTKMFRDAHAVRLDDDRTGCCFSFFYSCVIPTDINADWNIGQILNHAMNNDNRSRKVCVDLGWVDANGWLTVKGKAVQTICKLKPEVTHQLSLHVI